MLLWFTSIHPPQRSIAIICLFSKGRHPGIKFQEAQSVYHKTQVPFAMELHRGCVLESLAGAFSPVYIDQGLCIFLLL